MASLRVLAFDHEGRPVQFDTWLDDLQLYLLSDSKDSVSLFDLVSGAAPAPPTTADSLTRSQWLTRDAAARLAIRNHLPLAECAHFGQHRTAQALYDAVVTRYSPPATAALGSLLLPYLFPELDHFLSLDPTSLTVDLLEQHLLAVETSAVAVGAAHGTPRSPFFEGCSPSPLAPSYTSAAAANVFVPEDVGAASASAKRRTSKGKGGRSDGGGSGSGGGGSGSGGGGSSEGGGGGGTVGGSGGSGGGGGGSSGSGSVGTNSSGTGARRTCGRLHTQQRCFSRLDDAWRAEFGDDVKLPRWADLLKSSLAIFDLDFDAILYAMYALSVTAEGDCYRCVPPDPGIAAAALGASESGTLPGTAPAEAFHTFTSDFGASRCLHLLSFSTNLVSTAALQDAMVTATTPGGQRVSICTCTRMGSHLATFTRRPGSSLYTLATKPSPVAASAQVSASGQVATSCSCHLLLHQTLLWHHYLGHPSLPRLRGIHSRLLVSCLTRSLPPLPPLPAPPCLPCVEGWQRAAPHSSSFPPTTAPLQTLHMDVGGEFSSTLLREFCHGEGILQSFTLSDSPQQNGIAERRIGLVMEVARTSMIHAASPHFLWSFAVRYAAHQLNLWPHVSLLETSPTLRWTGKVGDVSVFRVWGSRPFVRDTSVDKLSPRAIPCVFLGFVPDAPGWPFYHPTSRRVFPSQDVTFDKSVPFCRLFPYRSAPPPPPPLFLAPGPPPVDPLPPQGPAPSGVSEVDPLPGHAPVQVAVDSGAARGAASGGAEPGGAGPGGAEFEGAETRGAEPRGFETGGAEPRGVEPRGVATGSGEPGGAEPEGVEPGGAALEGAESGGAEPQGAASSRASGAGGAGAAGAGGPGVAAGAGVTGGTATTGPGGTRTRGTGAAETSAVEGAGAGDLTESGTTGAGGAGAGGAGVGGPGAGGAGVGGPGVGGAGAGGAGAVDPGGSVRPRPYFVPLLHQRREPTSRPVSPVRTARCVPRSRLPPVPGTHAMTLRPSSVPLRVPLPTPPESSLPEVPDPESDRARAASPTVSHLLATAVSDPSVESAVASALVAELLDFAAACRLDYASALAAESAFASPLSVGGECALGTDVLEDRQEDFECLVAAIPRFASMLLAPEGDPDAPGIPTPHSYAEAITGPYSSQWQAAMDAEMASWKSTGTYDDEVPPPGANIVDGMWIFKVKRPLGSPPAFKARYFARGFSQRQGVDYFQTFSPTSEMTTLRVLLHVAAQRDYELHSLDFSTAFLQGSLHEEIWSRRPPGFTYSFLASTLWSLRRPVYGLRQAPREWHDTLRTTLAALGFAPATADPSLFLRTNTLLPPFYVLVYVDDLVFATADIEALTLVKSELQKRHTCTDLGELRSYLGFQVTRDRAQRTITLTQSHMVHPVLQRLGFQISSPQPTPLSTSHSLSAPPSNEPVEPNGPYLELVGCLMFLMTCTRPDLAYPLSLLARYVAPGRHRKGYTYSLGSGSVSWRSTRSSSVLSSSCEAEIYAGAMAAQEIRWLTYLLTDLGDQPRSPPFLYVDNKAMIALC
ncbi:unnamed protein product [Closterium sp. NIES-53]